LKGWRSNGLRLAAVWELELQMFIIKTKVQMSKKDEATTVSPNDSKPIVMRSLPSDEELFAIVEKMVFEQTSADPMTECVNKMNLLRQFINGFLLDGNDA
jgi:hypothetical protein